MIEKQASQYSIIVSSALIDLPGTQSNRLNSGCYLSTHASEIQSGIGAFVVFDGLMRGNTAWDGCNVQLSSMFLDYYPAMVLPRLEKMVQDAFERWQLIYVYLHHRVGEILPCEKIVHLKVGATHRLDAFEAAGYIMDLIKTCGPFWKKEKSIDGRSRWVEPRPQDIQALNRWA